MPDGSAAVPHRDPDLPWYYGEPWVGALADVTVEQREAILGTFALLRYAGARWHQRDGYALAVAPDLSGATLTLRFDGRPAAEAAPVLDEAAIVEGWLLKRGLVALPAAAVALTADEAMASVLMPPEAFDDLVAIADDPAPELLTPEDVLLAESLQAEDLELAFPGDDAEISPEEVDQVVGHVMGEVERQMDADDALLARVLEAVQEGLGTFIPELGAVALTHSDLEALVPVTAPALSTADLEAPTERAAADLEQIAAEAEELDSEERLREALRAADDAQVAVLEAEGMAPRRMPPAPRHPMVPASRARLAAGLSKLPVQRAAALADVPDPDRGERIREAVAAELERHQERERRAGRAAPAPTRAAKLHGSTFTAQQDLDLALGYADGIPLAVLEETVGQPPAAMKARWAELNPSKLKPRQLEGLIASLRAKAEADLHPF